MAGEAPWWKENANSKDAVVAHTPDESAYHEMAQDQQGLTAGHPKARGTMIPRANDDGTSKGFDADKAGVVHVDPDAPDGGAIVDLRKVRPADMLLAIRGTRGHHEAFYKLSRVASGDDPRATVPGVEIKPKRENPVMAGYVVPKADDDGTQILEEPETDEMTNSAVKTVPGPTPAPPRIAPTPAPPPQPAPTPEPLPAPPPSPLAVSPPQPDPNIAKLTELMGGLATGLQYLIDREATRQTPEETVPDAPVETSKSEPQHIDDWNGDDPRPGLIAGFETLDIDFIVGPLPVKPTKKVTIDLGAMGVISTKFHAVREGKGCLVLVYDTRYEEGQQWLPPERGLEPMTLHCHDTGKDYTIHSMGQHYDLGVLDHVVLVLNDAAADRGPMPVPE